MAEEHPSARDASRSSRRASGIPNWISSGASRRRSAKPYAREAYRCRRRNALHALTFSVATSRRRDECGYLKYHTSCRTTRVSPFRRPSLAVHDLRQPGSFVLPASWFWRPGRSLGVVVFGDRLRWHLACCTARASVKYQRLCQTRLVHYRFYTTYGDD